MTFESLGNHPGKQSCRRSFLRHSSLSLGGLAFAEFLNASDSTPVSSKVRSSGSVAPPHFSPKAKSVIFLFMAGGPSHIDLFDPKPLLNRLDGELIPEHLLKDHQQFALIRGKPALKGSTFRFQPHGDSGIVVSELLPHLSQVVDELCVIRSMKTTTNVHDPGVNMMNCGTVDFGRPTLGAWLSYGLGSENSNLPHYVVLTSGADDGQPLLQNFWGNGFLDSRHQGVPFQPGKDPVLHLRNPSGTSKEQRRDQLDLMAWMNRRHFEKIHDPEILSRQSAYEMAFRMQTSVPELVDLSEESEATLQSYGAVSGESSFANNCLLARRLVERGVRFVQLYDRGWDSHTDIQREHRRQCDASDRPVAALIKDLKQRGLLDETLVIWGGEFGRTPVAQVSGNSYGRDHHPHAFTMWMAGGGIRPGMTFGATDEYGYHVVDNVVHVHDLHATVLRLLGLDHERFTFNFKGLDLGLTGVEPARVVSELCR